MTLAQSTLAEKNKTRIARQFSRAALHYDALAQVQLDIALDAKAMLPPHSASLLDIGCGTGRITRQLGQLNTQILAMDLAYGMLQQASLNTARQSAKNITWVQGDAEQLPVKNHSLDTVFSSMALQWCPSPERVMSELYRVLVPQGQVVLAMMVQGSFSELVQSWAKIDAGCHVNQFYSAEVWLQAMQKSGLRGSIKQQCYQTWHPNIRHLLGSIKGVGANVLLDNKQPLTKGMPVNRQQLSVLEMFYFSQFGANQQLPLSYHIVFLQCVKI